MSQTESDLVFLERRIYRAPKSYAKTYLKLEKLKEELKGYGMTDILEKDKDQLQELLDKRGPSVTQKIHPEDVHEIRHGKHADKSSHKVGKIYNTTSGNIRQIRNYRTFKHLP
jgi:DNA-directed RNA polymerase sigma subunit (sigma70/sigma32)